MDIKELSKRAVEIKEKYKELEKKKYGREWDAQDIFTGFVSDVGDLSRLVLAKEGLMNIDDYEKAIKHELSDCLWALFVLADKYGVDIERSFFENMDELEKRINEEIEN